MVAEGRAIITRVLYPAERSADVGTNKANQQPDTIKCPADFLYTLQNFLAENLGGQEFAS